MVMSLILFFVSLLVLVLFALPAIKATLRGQKRGIKEYGLVAIGLIAFIFIMSVRGMFYYAEAGYSYLVQYPNGTQVGEVKPGYHLKWFGEAEPFNKYITVKADDYNDKEVSALIPPIEGRFTDSVVADIEVTARFQLPTVEEDFLKMAVAFRSQKNLENSTLIPVLKEVVRNSARTMTAQDYIAGKGGEFENSILDQLREGLYFLDTKEIRPEGKKDTTTDDDRGIEQSQVVRYEVNKKTDENGNIMRKPTALIDYKIIVTQSNVSNVDPEPKFKEMIGKQRDAAAEASVKKQEAKKAEYTKQQIIAEGEASKAQIQVELEQEQIRTLIAAETKKKEAAIALEESKILKAKAEQEAQTKKIAADAEAYQKRKVIEADNALTQKLETLEKIAKYTADAMKEVNVPQTMIISGDSGKAMGGYSQAQQLMDTMLVQTTKQLNLDLKVKK